MSLEKGRGRPMYCGTLEGESVNMLAGMWLLTYQEANDEQNDEDEDIEYANLEPSWERC